MLTTVVLAVEWFGLLIFSAVLWAWFLKVGLKWAKVPEATIKKVIVATASVIVLQMASNVLFAVLSAFIDVPVRWVFWQLMTAAVVPWVAIIAIFKVPFSSALRAWLPTLMASGITLAFVLLVSRPYVFEAFSQPTNSMAPTLVGEHWQSVCSECGQPNYGSPVESYFGPPGPQRMICDHFHVTQASIADTTVYSGDHFMVAKFLTPQRWDLVVYQFPAAPEVLYVSRLVGLPGETIHIADGAVWADGQKLTPPDSLSGIEYLPEIPGVRPFSLWGTPNQPAILGDDEYFVLGDYSAQASDSRVWDQGAPGHHPYAVPAAYLKGVVTHTHWPPARWRIHR